MLEKYTLFEENDSLKEDIENLALRLSELEKAVKEKEIPVIILFEGWSASGKGEVIAKLIKCFDPRSYKVISTYEASENDERRPWLYRFWKNIPEKSRFSILDRSWYRETVFEYMKDNISRSDFDGRINDINIFERQLTDDGYVIIKFFLNISQEEQKKRLEKLQSSKLTKWRVNDDDLKSNKWYEHRKKWYKRMIENTDTKNAKWNIIPADNLKQAVFKIYTDTIEILENVCNGDIKKSETVSEVETVTMPKLADIDLSPVFPEEFYKEELKIQQKRLEKLQSKCYIQKLPVIICYEGWDAGGKGGSIKRITNALDPRGYEVIPISAPDRHELARHYLWRFWTKIGKSGHITIFDRTWYGRVMVEKIEKFTPLERCNQAYQEINEFEKQLNEWGAVVIKFWLHIDQNEQLKRFTDRQNTPSKQWKITDEDWRNRDKWDIYESAVDEMIEKTSTTYAPWHIIEANDKRYARIKTLKIINDTIEKALE